MALHTRPESTARRIAASLGRGKSIARRRIHADPGAVIGHYQMPPDRTGRRHTITAAAEVMLSPTVSKQRKGIQQNWQNDVWELRDEVGEFRFSGDRLARSVSRMRLFVGQMQPGADEPVEITEGVPYDLGAQLFADIGATQQNLLRGGQHHGFNGETYLVISQNLDGSLQWQACSTSELTPAGSTWQYTDGVESRMLSRETDLVIRSWNPHPRLAAYADCGARAVLPVARELRGLTQRVGAEIDSRLAGAGVLFVPESISLLNGQVKVSGENGDLDPFVAGLLESMVTPIRDRGSAAAVVPLVAKVPADAVDKIKHLTFAGTLDPKAGEYTDRAIKRIALGMDSPPETLLGLGDNSNHWGAWAVGEEDVAIAIAPMTATLCHSLTTGWLRPALQQLGVADAHTYLVWFDAGNLELRADRSKDATTLHDKNVVSDDTLRRETGFGTTDAPNPAELRRRILTQLLMLNPAFAPVILPELGIPGLDWSKVIASSSSSPDTGDDNPDDGGDGSGDAFDDTRALPEMPDGPDGEDTGPPGQDL